MKPRDLEQAPSAQQQARGAFLRDVEACFVVLRGRGVVWSPDDAARAASWFDLGLSAPTVVTVLQARMQAFRYLRGAGAAVPRDLRWYEPALLDACRHRMRLGTSLLDPLQAEGVRDVAPQGPLLHLLAEAIALRSTATHVIWQHLLDASAQRLEAALTGNTADWPGEDQPSLADADEVCAKLQSAYLKTLRAALGDAEREAQQAFVAQQLGPAGQRLGKKALAERTKWLELQWAAAILGLRWPTAAGFVDPREAA